MILDIKKVLKGGVLAQLITLLFYPIITRMYEPSDMGVQAIFLALVNVISAGAAFALPIAIVLEKDEEVVKKLVNISLILSIIISIVICIIIYMLSIYLDFMNVFIERLGGGIWIIPGAVGLGTLGVVTGQILSRNQQFQQISSMTWKSSLILNVSKLGMAGFGSYGLILANTFFGLFRYIFSGEKIRIYFQSIKDLKLGGGVIGKYSQFVKYRMPQSVLFLVSSSVPVYYFSYYADLEFVGFLGLAMGIIALPTNVVVSSVSQVLYPKSVELTDQGKGLIEYLLMATGFVLLLILPFFFLIFFIGEELFSMVFGTKWANAGVICSALVYMYFAECIARPMLSLTPVIGWQKQLLVYELGLLIVKVSSLFLLSNYIYNQAEAIEIIHTYSLVCTVYISLFVLCMFSFLYFKERCVG
jgi:O-antigen/teichoic acid export membrane protein